MEVPVTLIHGKESASPIALVEVSDRLLKHPRTLDYLARFVSAKRSDAGAPLVNSLTKFITDTGLAKPAKQSLTTLLEHQIKAGQLHPALAPLIAVKPTPAQLAIKLLDALVRAAESAGDYPITEAAWLRQAGGTIAANEFKAALKEPALSSRLVICKASLDGKQLAYATREQLIALDSRLLKAAFELAVKQSQSGKKLKPSLGFTAPKLAESLIKSKVDQQSWSTLSGRSSNMARSMPATPRCFTMANESSLDEAM